MPASVAVTMGTSTPSGTPLLSPTTASFIPDSSPADGYNQDSSGLPGILGSIGLFFYVYYSSLIGFLGAYNCGISCPKGVESSPIDLSPITATHASLAAFVVADVVMAQWLSSGSCV